MKRFVTVWAALAMALCAVTAQTQPSWPDGGREAKAGSRWWWLGSAVDEENLRWQMGQLSDAGIGNLEITPIYGVKGNEANNIQFLSSKWLDMLNYTQQQGDALGIDIDMTTGTGWPFGGPMVKNTESASKLVTETLNVTGDGSTEQKLTLTTSGATLQRVMAFPKSGNDGQVTDLTDMVNGKTVTWTAPAGDWQVIAAYNQYAVMQVKRPSPGSSGNVLDYFDADAVANYLSYFDSRFAAGNGRWPHSFFNDSYEIGQADWTPKMFEQFEARRGYKLEENLDKLLAGDSQVYADYRQTLSDMLLENFTMQWTRWAHSHGATTRNQAHGSPGNLIDLYAAADIPEIENFYMTPFGIKGLRDDKGFYNTALSSRATLKYASSAAHITGKRLTSSETMTWLTEHFRTSLSQIKPELDLLFTAGVNHVLFHGTAYSPQDAPWPGWKFYASIDMSPTNSIWQDAPAMMKYIERVQSFMQMGQPDNDVLVYAPFAHAMHKTTGDFKNRMVQFDINTMSSKMSEMEQCVNTLEAMGLDCDYTSERLLMHTTYTDGMIVTEGGARYQALVIPVTDHLPDSVRNHVEELRLQGAQVVEGRTAADLQALTATPEEMRTALSLSVIRRSNANGHHYFVSNLTPNDAEGYVSLAVPFKSVVLFDPLTGDISTASVADGKVWISLKSGQSVILQTYDTEVTTDNTAGPVQELAGLDIGGSWTLTFDDGQQYTLEQLQSWETLNEKTASLMGTGTYETTFSVTAAQMKTATAGFRLNLGDVRESARVWLNDQYLGCAWSVPFVIDCRGAVREGTNTLRIAVTNLPANRISQMDRDGVEWRIFEDINMSNISTATYDKWTPVPSGLNSRVELIPLAAQGTAMSVEMEGLAQAADGYYYPQYRLTLPTGCTQQDISMTDANGSMFSGYQTLQNGDGSVALTVTGCLPEKAIIQVTDKEGQAHYAYVAALGGYNRTMAIDFTSAEGLSAGWGLMKTTTALTGFSGSGKLAWYRSAKSVTSNDDLYDGLTFNSEKNTYYALYPGYGMNGFNDFSISVNNAEKGDLCHLSYLLGDGSTTYNAADSVSVFVSCENAADGLTIPLHGRNSYYVYRSLTVYRPADTATAIRETGIKPYHDGSNVYDLMGRPVANGSNVNGKLRRGVYVHQGRVIVVR
jgi:hypothetical protein